MGDAEQDDPGPVHRSRFWSWTFVSISALPWSAFSVGLWLRSQGRSVSLSTEIEVALVIAVFLAAVVAFAEIRFLRHVRLHEQIIFLFLLFAFPAGLVAASAVW